MTLNFVCLLRINELKQGEILWRHIKMCEAINHSLTICSITGNNLL